MIKREWQQRVVFIICLFIAAEGVAQSDQNTLEDKISGMQVGVISTQIFQERIISENTLIKYEFGVNYQFKSIEDANSLAFLVIPEVGLTVRQYPNLLNREFWVKRKDNNCGNFIGVNIFNDIRKIPFDYEFIPGTRSFINVLGEVGMRRMLGKSAALELSAAAGFRKELYKPVFKEIAFIVDLELNFVFLF